MERPGHPRTLPLRFHPAGRWSITAFPACVILPQINRQPMCIWVVKPPFTQYISEADSGSLRQTERLFQPLMVHGRRILRGKFPKTRLPVHACRHGSGACGNSHSQGYVTVRAKLLTSGNVYRNDFDVV